MRDDFCAMILTHGRPTNVRTIGTLRSGGYTGPIILVVDDQDATLGEYLEHHEDVAVFSKEEVDTDAVYNSGPKKSPVWARNACWKIARERGFRYLVMLDDDYIEIKHRRGGRSIAHPGKSSKGATEDQIGYHKWPIGNLDRVFEAFVRFMESTPTATIAFSQGGDHFGGAGNSVNRLRRKAMNSFFLDVERAFPFVGRMNDDVDTYVTHGSRGLLFFTYWPIQLEQLQTQTNPGGVTEAYRNMGTYAKSFETVMMHPSSVHIREMGRMHKRIHHKIDPRRTYPKIVSEALKR